MFLLPVYLLILLTGLILYTRRKPAQVSRPLYVKFIWFAGIVCGMYYGLYYVPSITPVVHGILVVLGFIEIAKACFRQSWAFLIITASALVFALFFESGFNQQIPHANVFLCVASFDAFSQFTGQLIGKRPLWKAISPNKTIEGSLGGLVVCVFTAFMVLHSLLAGFAIALLSLSGDLLASAIKRHAQLKDFGTVLPGQGGVLDRFDSYIFCSAAYSFLSLTIGL